MVSRFKALVIGGISLTVVALLLLGGFSGAGDSWWTNKERYNPDMQIEPFSEHPMSTLVEWSSDGKWICAATWDNIIQIYEVDSGLLQCSFQETNRINSMEWSPRGNSLLWCCGDEIKLWDVFHGSSPIVFANLENASAIAWSPDGKRIASFSHYYWYDDSTDSTSVNITLSIYSATNRSILSISNDPFVWYTWLTIEWSSDGNEIISWSEENISIWDPSTGSKSDSTLGHYSLTCPNVTADVKWLSLSIGGREILRNGWRGSNGMDYFGSGRNPGYISKSHDGRELALGYANRTIICKRIGINGQDSFTTYSIKGIHMGNPVLAWSLDDKRILNANNIEGIKIYALDSDGDGIPDYKDVFPTVNENFIFFSNLVAAAGMLWTTVILSHRPRRLKAA